MDLGAIQIKMSRFSGRFNAAWKGNFAEQSSPNNGAPILRLRDVTMGS
jgi:hypothetical protein